MEQAGALARLTEALEADARVEAALVFGSVARGDARPDSDLDLAVRWASPQARQQVEQDLLTWIGRLSVAAEREVHLVDLERADPPLARRVLAEGKVLMDRSPARTRALLTHRLLEYFDWEYARGVIDRGLRTRLGVHDG
jgi:predicted nucleotidyltransferase